MHVRPDVQPGFHPRAHHHGALPRQALNGPDKNIRHLGHNAGHNGPLHRLDVPAVQLEHPHEVQGASIFTVSALTFQFGAEPDVTVFFKQCDGDMDIADSHSQNQSAQPLHDQIHIVFIIASNPEQCKREPPPEFGPVEVPQVVKYCPG